MDHEFISNTRIKNANSNMEENKFFCDLQGKNSFQLIDHFVEAVLLAGKGEVTQ